MALKNSHPAGDHPKGGKPKIGTLLAFGEMFLKSEGVKKIFKKRLISNLVFFMRGRGLKFKIFPFRERIFIETKSPKKCLEILKNVFGISWVSSCLFLAFTKVTASKFEKTTLEEVCKFVKRNYSKWIKVGQKYALRVIREKGRTREKREEIIDKVAEVIKRKVNLSNPQKEIFIERRRGGWFLYFKKEKGQGGLPVGCEGKVLTLMSGGIDSPVAGFLMAKRGAENVWLHFHSYPLVSKASIEKVKELAKVFLNFQPRLKIYNVGFKDAQMEIKTKTPPKYRILLYRRLMLRIAEEIARKEACIAMVTGESLGQVSSQTLINIGIIEEVVNVPIMRPLIGMDKEEIISLAKKIGTFEISVRPQEDCCTLFVPKHPTAQGKLEEVELLEKKLEIEKLIQKSITGLDISNFIC